MDFPEKTQRSSKRKLSGLLGEGLVAFWEKTQRTSRINLNGLLVEDLVVFW